MSRLKCKKTRKVFEKGLLVAVLALHLGPYQDMQASVEPQPTEEELEKKLIEDSKYERP